MINFSTPVDQLGFTVITNQNVGNINSTLRSISYLLQRHSISSWGFSVIRSNGIPLNQTDLQIELLKALRRDFPFIFSNNRVPLQFYDQFG